MYTLCTYALVSAFYAENPSRNMSVNGWIWTKSKFLGLAIAVDMIGKAIITLHDLRERYSITFPTGYGRCAVPTRRQVMFSRWRSRFAPRTFARVRSA